MRASACLLGALAALSLAACEKDPGAQLAPRPPVAYVRYVHIVPDTSALDWRPIDAVQNSPWAYAMTFRANTPYQAMGAGARHLRIFPTSDNISITSQVVVDTTINFTANTYYTVIHVGMARPSGTPADRLWVIEDQIPATIGATQVAMRVINAGVGLGTLNAESGGASAGPFSALASGVAYGTAGAYALVSTGDRFLRVTDGVGATVAAAVQAPVGSAAVNGTSAIGGTSIGGSAITAIIVPRSVAGSLAPQGFSTPSVIYLIDRAGK